MEFGGQEASPLYMSLLHLGRELCHEDSLDQALTENLAVFS